MRKLNLFLLVVSLSSCFFPSNLDAQNISYEFNHQDNLPYNDRGTQCYNWNNGILVLGNADAGNNTTFCLLTFLDTFGNITWNKVLSFPSYSPGTAWTTGNALTFTNNSGFYVTGITGLGPAGGVHGFFAKFDSNGDTVFTRIYMDSVNNYPTDMIAVSPDTLLALVLYNQGSDRINKLDTLGNIISSCAMTTSTDPVSIRLRRQIMQGPDGKIYVGGNYNCSSGIFIDVYDHNLALVASWYPVNSSWENFSRLTVFNNEIYLTSIAAPPNPTSNYYYQVNVGKLNSSNGTYQFSNAIGLPGENGNSFGTAVVNPNCLAVQLASGTSETQYLFFLDSLCNVTWHTPLMSGWECYGITVTPSHKIAGTGGDDQGTSRHWNFLTENIENYLLVAPTAGVSEFDPSSVITIYPVPNNGNMQVRLDGDGFSALHVFNSIGEELFVEYLDEQQADQQIRIFLEDAAEGLYIVQVVKNKETVSQKVMISR